MAKKRRVRRGLDRAAQEFALDLLFQASNGRVGRAKASTSEGDNSISFRDKRALLDSITKLLAAQKDPGGDEYEDGLIDFKERLGGGDSGEASSGTDTGEDETGVHPPIPGADEI